MKLFDDLLDRYSARDLSTRVKGMIITGFVLCAGFGLILYLFLTSIQTVAISGSGRFEPDTTPTVSVTVASDTIQLLADSDLLNLELDDPTDGIVRVNAPVLSIDPASSSLKIDASGFPKSFRALQSFSLRIVLISKPFWKMLWSN